MKISVNCRRCKNLIELIRLKNKYIRLLGDEIDEIAPIADAHGWRSTRYEAGCEIRKQINKKWYKCFGNGK